MLKKAVVVLGIILMPGFLFAQIHGMEDLQIKHTEFSVGAVLMNMEPINNYTADCGFSSFGYMPLLFGFAQKNKVDDKTYWGIRFMTTLAGLDMLAPNFLKREIGAARDENSRAEMSITMGEFTMEYELLKFGGLSVNVGGGIGFGGTRLTILEADNGQSGRFWNISCLLKPQAKLCYYFLEGSGTGFILALNVAYNYMPVTGWIHDAGSLPCPSPFNLSGASADISISFPFGIKQ
jgi:hypothetical protein